MTDQSPSQPAPSHFVEIAQPGCDVRKCCEPAAWYIEGAYVCAPHGNPRRSDEHAQAEPGRLVERGDTDPDVGVEGAAGGATPATRLEASAEPAGEVGRARPGLTGRAPLTRAIDDLPSADPLAEVFWLHRVFGDWDDDELTCGCGATPTEEAREEPFGDQRWHDEHLADAVRAYSPGRSQGGDPS